MKIRLLNDGGYGDMDGVAFPVEVEARHLEKHRMFEVTGAEIIRVGAPARKWDADYYYAWDYDAGEAEAV